MEHQATTLTLDQEAVLRFLAFECETAAKLVSKPIGLYLTTWAQALSFGLFGQDGLDRLHNIITHPPYSPAAEPLETALDAELVLDAQALGYAACFQLWRMLQIDPTVRADGNFLKDANKALGHITRRFFEFVGVDKTITDAVDCAVKQATRLEDRFDEFRKAALLAGARNNVGQPAQQSNQQAWLNLSPDGTIN